MGKQKFNDYFLGFDIGTNSIGWAVTDLKYNILRFNKKDMWGSRLFEEAQTAKVRRVYRNSRRRLDRRKRRLKLLEELFLEEISKVDNTFFMRLEESNLHNEDKSFDFRFPIFNDRDYTDKDYYKEYPTIYHLRNALIKEDKKFDIRLLFLALHHILKYRGHFIFEGQDFNNITDFKEVFFELSSYLRENMEEFINPNLCDDIKEIICSKQNKSKKKTAFSSIITSKTIQSVLYCCVGGNVKFKDIFVDYENSKDGVNLSEIDYDEKRDEIALKVGEDILLVDICKKVYDFMILNDTLKGKKYISESKVGLYCEHKKDLDTLKYIFKKYLTQKDYFNFFRNEKISNNYVSYISTHLNDGKKKKRLKSCSQDDLNKEISKYISKIELEKCNLELLNSLKLKLAEKKFLPKLKTKDNGVVPYQVNEIELEKILENQSKYHQFLTEDICRKIVSLFEFRIPYYIGPLKGGFSWVVFNKGCENEKITPWNFKDIVNEEESSKVFIEKMTNKCTYLKTENVLPKNSLLLSEFELLNELNKVKIKNEFIDYELKNQIIEELFKTTSKITKGKFVDYLKTKQIFVDKNDISGIQKEFNSKLDSYIKFKNIIGDKIDTIQGYNFVEKCIEYKCFYGDDRKLFEKAIKNTEFRDFIEKYITDDELKKINKLKFNKWGRLSKKLLTELSFKNIVDKEYFENIINTLKKTNYNFMEFTSKKFNLLEKIKENTQEDELKKFDINEYVDNLYVSPSVKRSIIQTYKIAMEIKKITGKNPKKIFIEMARGGGEKGKITEKRKEHIKKLYSEMKDSNEEFLNNLDSLKISVENYDDNRLRQKKLFLYFMQLGKSMYTGKDIDLSELLNSNTYDIDHIIPQSKTKDDSFDNIVLVEKTINAHKSNSDYIDESIRFNMTKFWKFLREKGFISIEKYNRLRRSTPFTKSELANFIARQLVTTRQSTLEVKKLFELIFSTDIEIADVICSKAGLVSDFREKFDIIKVREVNDAHHARDAYLNIVVGNVFDTKFTKNYWKFIENRKNEDNKEPYNFKKIFERDVIKEENVAWVFSKDETKYNTINTVKDMIYKKTANITQMLTEGKGQLFNLTILKKSKVDEKLKIVSNLPKKLKSKNLSSYEIASRYGYFGSLNPAYFVVFKYTDKKKRVFGFNRVCITDKNRINSSKDIENIIEKQGYKDPKFIKKVSINQKILVDGFPYRIVGCDSSGKLEIKNDKVLYLKDKYLKYAKDLSNFYKQNENIKETETMKYRVNFLKRVCNDGKNETYEEVKNRLNSEFEELYKELSDKLKSKEYINYYNSKKYDEFVNLFEDFKNLDLIDKSKILLEFLNLFNRTTICSLKILGKAESFGRLHLRSFKQFVEKDIKFIDESITGLFVKKERLK